MINSVETVTLTAKDAANYIGISYWTILDLVKERKIPHFKVGTKALFRKEAIDNWMNDQEKLSTAIAEESQFGAIRKIKG